MGTPHAILIAGPTASGKSALAVALAERFGGTVINADSMQVYRDLRILTARPAPSDEARAPHRLYGHVPATEPYSAGRYVREAACAIMAAQADGRVPIVVGGTGLYFKALLEGLAPLPPVDPAVRAHWRAAAATSGAAALHGVLAGRDATMAARLAPGDTQRIVRALEVLESTGRSLADWQRVRGEPVLREAATVRLVLAPPREVILARVEARFAAMVAGGAVEEVAALVRFGLDPTLPVLRAVGVPPLVRLLAGAIDHATAVAAGQSDTRRYVKRQMTWLRGHMMSWNWISEQQMKRHVYISSNLIDKGVDVSGGPA
ncbi:MAG: tRNA (adenosine(37)-N6)-dimethylallyltransferase MiaA [Hyphomicrobiaceae bacterium]